MVTKADIVIIGGGIIGLATAYHLRKMGAKGIVVLERDLIGEGSTGKCVGGIRCQFSTEVNIKFSLESVKFFENFKEEMGVDPEFIRCGYLFLITKEEGIELFKKAVELQRSLGVNSEYLSPEEIKKIVPIINVEDVLGGSYSPTDGFAGPYEVLSAFAKRLREMGVRILERCEAVGIEVEGSRIKSVEAKTDKICTGIVLDAAGVWSSFVSKMVGIDIPVKPYRRQVFVTKPIEGLMENMPMIIDFYTEWSGRNEMGGLLMSGKKDNEGIFSTNTDWDSLSEYVDKGLHRIPILEKAEFLRGWAGLLDISPDNHAIMGKADEIEGFYYSTGFSGHGFMHGPIAGKVMAELILEGKTSFEDITSLRLERFKEGKEILEPLTNR